MRITVTLSDEVGAKIKTIPQNRRPMFVERAIVLAFEQIESDDILRFIARKPSKGATSAGIRPKPAGKGKKSGAKDPEDDGLSSALGEFGEG